MNTRIVSTVALGALLLFCICLLGMGCSQDSTVISSPADGDTGLSTGLGSETASDMDSATYNTYDPTTDEHLNNTEDTDTTDDETAYDDWNPNDKTQDDEDDWNPYNPKNKDGGA